MAGSISKLPASVKEFIPYISSKPNGSMLELLAPYREYEAKLRELYAQEPGNPLLVEPHCNAVPLFDGHEAKLKIRARDLAQESESDQAKYIMPLPDHLRKPDGAAAVLPSLTDFEHNFNIFSETSVSEMDWTNVVAAGSSVLTSLVPIPAEHAGSKRSIRNYYHSVIAPASDVDLFLYGLTEEQALEKIKQIESSIKNTILTETTTIRTKNCITIVSKYPIRHVQIVLRIYKSVSEILTGFDVDCSCVAYDGKQVYATPRAISALVTQTNEIDLSRRSPSYEARLSKYSHRGFEVHWADLDRSRIDPTIFERSFARTVGLARLLVLEKLPTNNAREKYRVSRREERGRPASGGNYRHARRGNIKDAHEDEIADWVEEDDISNYHSFTIPYGEKFHARNIERLFYAKDLLLNAEWNTTDREVNLHRHPAFIGDAEDVFEDCCGSCPVPESPDELQIAEEEAKTCVSGKVSFLTDDPGRQAIGSFNPITDTDWADMAYVGNTGRLCQAIVDEDLATVEECLVKDGIDPNRRDYTGRTPLHLAAMSSSPAVVKCLLDHGAYLIPHLADGQTALHLAVIRGDVEIIKALHEKNEEHKLAKLEAERAAGTEDDAETVEPDGSDADSEVSGDTSAYVKVEFCDKLLVDAVEVDADPNKIEPKDDVLDPNAVAWDTGCAAHHLAITFGQTRALEFLLDQFGSDPNIPIKLMNTYNREPAGAILSLALALTLRPEQAKPVIDTLLSSGAKSSQADVKGNTVLQYFAHHGYELLEYLIKQDPIHVKSVLNWVNVRHQDFYSRSSGYPLKSAILTRNPKAAAKLLELGASPVISYESWVQGCRWLKSRYGDHYNASEQDFNSRNVQPIILAIRSEQPAIVANLLEYGADVNTLSPEGWKNMYGERSEGANVLDEVRGKIAELTDPSRNGTYTWESYMPRKPTPLKEDEVYTLNLEPGSYQHWATCQFVQQAKEKYKNDLKSYHNSVQDRLTGGFEEKMQAVAKLAEEFRELEKNLISRGAKTFVEDKFGRNAIDLQNEVKEQEARLQQLRAQNKKAQYDRYKFKVDFGINVPGISSAQVTKYVNLFEAAWNGDLDIVRKLTTEPQGENKDEPPLLIAVTDGLSNSPFSVAILRGHLDMAMAMLAIASAQYAPEKKDRSYEIAEDGEDSEYDGADSGESRGIMLHERLPPSVRNQFTIDDIGQLSLLVQSQRSPLTLLRGHPPVRKFVESGCCVPSTNGEQPPPTVDSLLQYAIYRNDKELFLTLLNAMMKYEAEDNARKGDPTPKRFTMVLAEFTYALQLARFDFVSEMMKRTGVGIPFDQLVKLSGGAIPKKNSTQYEGLTIRGKKKKAWAQAYHCYEPTVNEPKTSSPLLLAAYHGSLESVEWLFSDAPVRLYQEYVEANTQYADVEAFSKLPGGAEGAISQWLDKQNHVALHCAILAKFDGDSKDPENASKFQVWTDQIEKLVAYLIKVMPESLKRKSPAGYTPLFLAFSLRKHTLAKMLLAAGADPTIRDNNGNNLVHSLLWQMPLNVRPDDHKAMQKTLELLDPALRQEMMLERNSYNCGANTPLHGWLKNRNIHWHAKCLKSKNCMGSMMLRTLLGLSNGEELYMVDGSGDTPVHAVVQAQNLNYLSIMTEKQPGCIWRENAVGRTPAELAMSSWLQARVTKAPPVTEDDYSYPRPRSMQRILDREGKGFVESNAAEEKSMETRVWEMCQERMTAAPAKRKLISLSEANEVAKRLAATEAARRARYAARNDDEEDEDEENMDFIIHDEVSEWYGQSREVW